MFLASSLALPVASVCASNIQSHSFAPSLTLYWHSRLPLEAETVVANKQTPSQLSPSLLYFPSSSRPASSPLLLFSDILLLPVSSRRCSLLFAFSASSACQLRNCNFTRALSFSAAISQVFANFLTTTASTTTAQSSARPLSVESTEETESAMTIIIKVCPRQQSNN